MPATASSRSRNPFDDMSKYWSEHLIPSGGWNKTRRGHLRHVLEYMNPKAWFLSESISLIAKPLPELYDIPRT